MQGILWNYTTIEGSTDYAVVKSLNKISTEHAVQITPWELCRRLRLHRARCREPRAASGKGADYHSE